MFKNLKINTKLIAVFLLVGLIPLGIVGIISLTKSKAALEKQAFNQLMALRDVKKGQIEKYFDERKGDMGVLTETVGTLRSEAFKKLEAVRDIKKNQIEGYFGDRLQLMTDVQKNLRFIGGVTDFAKAFARGGLGDAMYKGIYDMRHPGLKTFNDIFGFYDVFLIDTKGNVVFTVAGESDWGENLVSGSLSNSGLAKAYRDGKKGTTFTDFSWYEPSNEPGAFISTPLHNKEGNLIGVAAFQVSLAQINEIMGERSGMGSTGETYLVGPDRLMRSDSYLDPAGHSVEASFKNNTEVKTEAATLALAGTSGESVIIDYAGNPVLSAYCPIKVGDLTWACLAEIDVAEAFSPRDDQGKAFFQKYKEMYGYYDLFLINPDGYCFYTVTEEADYQTNLVNGTYSSSNLGELVRKVLDTKSFGFADFKPYAPSNGAPAAFVAQPYVHQGKVELIVALQLPLEAINSTMQERSGMGETGETYLVGPDKLMRSDSYLDPTGHSVTASFAGTVGNNGVDTEAARKALAGETGARIVIDYNGNPVLSAFAPLRVFGTQWAILAEIDEWEAFEAASSMQTSIIIIAFIMAGIVVLVGWLFARSISGPITKVVGLTEQMNAEFDQFVEVVDAIANNDLTQKIKQSEIESLGIDSKDEIGMLVNAIEGTIDSKAKIGASMERMTTNLTGMVRKLGENANQLVSAATEIASTSEQMARGSNDQAQQVAQVSTAIEEMSATIVESSKNATEATDASKGASDTATSGGQLVNETIQGMQKIADVVRESSESISKLAKSADQIGEIVGVIDDIADQTNLLALNAAIEAARAGEQGRGFAVVADEVRKLAERTGKATGEITEMIKGIQTETEEAVQSMETGVQEVDKGRELADKAGNSLTEIVNMSQRVMDMIQQIATSTDEQSVAAEQISKNIENVSSVTKETATGAEQAAAAAEQLNKNAEGLQQIVAQFKTT